MLRNHSWQMIERWWAELDSCARVPTVLNNRATGQLLQWPRVMDALLRASWSMQSRRSWSRAAALSPCHSALGSSQPPAGHPPQPASPAAHPLAAAQHRLPASPRRGHAPASDPTRLST